MKVIFRRVVSLAGRAYRALKSAHELYELAQAIGKLLGLDLWQQPEPLARPGPGDVPPGPDPSPDAARPWLAAGAA